MLQNAHSWLAPGGVLLLATVGDPWPAHSGYDGGAVRPGEFYQSVEWVDLTDWAKPFESHVIACEPNGDRFLLAVKADPARPERDAESLWNGAVTSAALRLNVGCGNYPLPGWTNIDATTDSAADVIAYVPPLSYGDGTVDEIYAGHFLEHLPRAQATTFLAECARVLRPGGKLGVVVPDTLEIMRAYVEGRPTKIEYPPGTVWSCDDLDDVCALALFSTVQSSPHVWAYDQRTLRRALETAGFVVTGEIDRQTDPRLGSGQWFQVGLDARKPEGVPV